MLVGLAGGLFASAMTPAADTRTWTTLPAQVQLVSGGAAGNEVPTLSFRVSGSDAPVSALLSAHAGKCSLSWGRSRPGLEASVTSFFHPVAAESRHEAQNKQFRAVLTTTFTPGPSLATNTNAAEGAL
jgi:hypothetical protein